LSSAEQEQKATMPYRRHVARLLALPLLALVPLAAQAHAAPPRQAAAPDRDAEDLAKFEHRALISRQLGATQMVVTEGLPLATWEMDKDDPYPAWFVHHATLFKIFPPAAIQPFVDMAYAARVQKIVARRCAILRQHGMTAMWSANEPAVLPEPFFTAHPELRGPRIDQIARSRRAHFAPNVDRPEMLAMYREAVRQALAACPEIETFNWVTTDAGSGFDWAPGLYPGANGSSTFRDRPLADRVVSFMRNVQDAARDAGHEVRVAINQIEPRQWMIPTFSADVLENIVRKLPRGLAVNGHEGPDGRPFATGRLRSNWGGAFYPVIGLVVPSFDAIQPSAAPERLLIDLGDDESVDFMGRLLGATRALPMGTRTQRIQALRAFAAAEVGEGDADRLVEMWSMLDEARHYLDTLDFGGMLRFGHVLNRWVTRPMVPFPLELTDAEKRDYRPFLFQAKGEEQASDLADIQAMQMYKGWGARLLFQRTVELTIPRVERARSLAEQLAADAGKAQARAQWSLTAKRLQALVYLLQSADHMVEYQAQLDRVRAIGAKPETDPVLGTQASWDRTDLVDLARREIDTMVELKALLESSDRPILDLAPTPQEETIMRLGPDLPQQLKHKIDVMNAHWRDYDRLFTVPNP
jgi:hypothetical protein